MEPEQYLNVLNSNEYSLMLYDDGLECYDQEGNLVLRKKDTGEIVCVTNTDDIRKLYNLPPKGDEEWYGEHANQSNSCVWLGQRTEECNRATEALIDLYMSPKYQELMSNKVMMKARVWEALAADLQSQGYMIADSPEEAGNRTFQKWRNITKAYKKYLKNPDEFGNDKRKKKPSYFDKMHETYSKTTKFDMQSSNDAVSSKIARPSCKIPPSRSKITDCSTEKHKKVISKDMVKFMIALSSTPKYKNIFDNHKYTNISKWKKIYCYIASVFYKFARTPLEGAHMLRQKWSTLKNKKNKLSGSTHYSSKLCKSIIEEVSKLSNETYETQPHPPEMIEEGKFTTDSVKFLLELLDSDKYNGLLYSHGKQLQFWNRICKDMMSKGFKVYGETKRNKCTSLYRKWKQLKHALIKYQLAKDSSLQKKRPPFYFQTLKIIFKEISMYHTLPKTKLKKESSSCRVNVTPITTCTCAQKEIIQPTENETKNVVLEAMDTATTLLREIKDTTAASYNHQKQALEDIIRILGRTSKNNSKLLLAISEFLIDAK